MTDAADTTALELQVDPERIDRNGQTGIFLRAKLNGHFGNYDMAELDRPSLRTFLRCRGGENHFAENVIAALLDHTRWDDEETSRIVLRFNEDPRPDGVVETGVQLDYYGGITISRMLLSAGSLIRDVAKAAAHNGDAEFADNLNKVADQLDETTETRRVTADQMI